MISNSLEHCHPRLAEIAEAWMRECAKRDIIIHITCTFRDKEDSVDLYKYGRSIPGPIILSSLEEKHYHRDKNGNPCSLAIDFFPSILGKASFVSKGKVKYAGVVADDFGLVWGGKANFNIDSFHIELDEEDYYEASCDSDDSD